MFEIIIYYIPNQIAQVVQQQQQQQQQQRRVTAATRGRLGLRVATSSEAKAAVTAYMHSFISVCVCVRETRSFNCFMC